MLERRGDHDVGVRMLDGLSDEEIVRRLAESGCEGPLWVTIQVDLWAHCLPAVEAMVLGGSLGHRTERLRRPIRLTETEREALQQDPHALREMFSIAFEKQLDYFVTCLLRGEGWRPGAGLPLRAYFLNGLLLHLKNPIRGWWRARRRLASEAPGFDEPDFAQSCDEDLGPEEWLIASEDIEALVTALHNFDPGLCRAFLIRADTGWSWSRIAQVVGLSANRLLALRQGFLEYLQNDNRHGEGGDYGS
jgi:hypothetical protein